MRTLQEMLASLESEITEGSEQREAEYRALVRQQESAERERRLARSGAGLAPNVRAKIVDGTLDPSGTKALRTVARWRQTHDFPVLVLVGAVGTGKSVACAWWLAAVGGLLRPMSSVARAWDSPTHGAAEERERLCGCNALVLDDVGTELDRQRQAVGAALRELLDARQSERTIITTNLTREQMCERYGDERLTSRLQLAAFVTCDGVDMRARKP